MESIVPNLSQPITCYFSDRRGRLCHLEHVCAGRLGTFSYNSFRWKAARLFNCLPQHVRNVSSCSTIIFKKKLDQFLCNLDDKPCTPHFDNSVVHVTKCDTNLFHVSLFLFFFPLMLYILEENIFFFINRCGVTTCGQTDQEPVKLSKVAKVSK